MRHRILFWGVMMGLLFFSLAYADVPKLINFQGRLTDATGKFVPDGKYYLTFRLYSDSTSGTAKWSEPESVIVSKGLFNVILGSVTSIPDTIFEHTTTWLGIQVGADPEMTPRQRMASVAYAYQSLKADTAYYAKVATNDGDWTVSGPDIYRLSGNVGIGTAVPGSILYIQTTGSYIGLGDFAGSGSKMRWYAGASTDPYFGTVTDHDLRFVTGSSVTEKMRITSSGSVGIGTAKPTSRLTIETKNFFGEDARRMIKMIPGNFQGRVYIESSIDYLDFQKSDSLGNFLDYLTISAKNGLFSGYGSFAGNGLFAGNVGIGTTNPTNILTVKQSSATDPIADAWTTYSSREYKRDIHELTPQEYRDALEKILSVPVVKFHYKAEDIKEKIGLIAEDAPEEILSEGNDKAISLNEYISLLHAALKAQQEEIEILKAKLEKLESNH